MITKFISEVKAEVDLNLEDNLVTSNNVRDDINGLRTIATPTNYGYNYAPTNYSSNYTGGTNSSIQIIKNIICKKAETVLKESDIRYGFYSGSTSDITETNEVKAEVERAVKYYYDTFMSLSVKAAKADEILTRISGRINTIIKEGQKHSSLLNINGNAIVNPKQIEDYLSDAAFGCDVLSLLTSGTVYGAIFFEVVSMVFGAASMVIRLCKGDFWGALEEFVCLIPFAGLGKVGKAVFKGGGKAVTKSIDPLVAITNKSSTKVSKLPKGSKFFDEVNDVSFDLVENVPVKKILKEINDEVKELFIKNLDDFSSETQKTVKLISRQKKYSKNKLLGLKQLEAYMELIKGGPMTRLLDAGINISVGGLSWSDTPEGMEVLKIIYENPNEALGSLYKNASKNFNRLMKGLLK